MRARRTVGALVGLGLVLWLMGWVVRRLVQDECHDTLQRFREAGI